MDEKILCGELNRAFDRDSHLTRRRALRQKKKNTNNSSAVASQNITANVIKCIQKNSNTYNINTISI